MIKDLIITSIETITAFDIVTGAFRFVLDELQDTTISQTQDSQEITGKAGRKLSTLKRNKAVTISGTNGLLSAGLMELQVGNEFKNQATEVMWTDYLTVDSTHKSETSYIAVGTTGAEIANLYIRNSDGTLGDKLEQASAAAAGKFAYDPESKELSFHTDIADGTEIVAYYNRQIMADVLENPSGKYSEKCALYIDAMCEDKCANIYRVQFYIPKADFSGEYSIEMSDSQVVHNFEADALSGACGTGANFFTYTVFGANTEDHIIM